MPQQIKSEILDNRRSGEYHVLSLTAPGISDIAKPGHFVTLAMGGEESSMVLRRAFAIHQVQSRGVYGGTLDIAVAVQGRGTKWLSERRRHDVVNLVGPLGKPFALPREGVSCLLVGGGYGSAPLFMLAQELRERGCRVDIVIGAASEPKLFGVLELKRLASALTITTDDGSSGVAGRVTDVLDEAIDRADRKSVV